MYFSIYSAVLASYLLALTSAGKLSCAQGCQEALSYLTFYGTDPTADYYVAQCQNTLRVQSIFVCMRHYCTLRDIRAGLTDFNRTCEEDGLVALLPYSIIDNITMKTVQTWPKIGSTNYTSSDEITTAVFLSSELYGLAKRTVDEWDYSESTRADYGYAMFGFWAIVLFVGLINRLIGRISTLCMKSASQSTYRSRFMPLDSLKLWIRHRLTVPALGHQRAAEPLGWCTVPPRLQSITISIFVVVNIVLCSVSYHLFDQNLYWSATSTQLARYLADRAGVLAIANLPLLWTFGMRNNVLLWLTGWSFSTFNIFHRWVARVATVEAVIHSVAYTAEAFFDGGKAEFDANWAERYWWCGVTGTIAMCLLCALSIYPMRKYLYEVFLMIHIALAVLFMAVLWYHVEIFDGKYNGYLWPCIAVWSFDRIVRLVRLILFNIPLQPSLVSYNADADIIRIDLPAPQILKPQPGTYYYIYILHGLKFWESHPFTLSSWNYASRVDSQGQTTSTDCNLSFIIRPHDSFTARFRNAIVRRRRDYGGSQNVSTSMRVLIEGPYGHHLRLESYSSLLFVVGGSGITVALSQLCAIFKSDCRLMRTIQIVWAVRDVTLFHDIYEREIEQWLAALEQPESIRLEIQVYVTTGPTSPSGSEKYGDTSGSSSPTAKEIGVIRSHEVSHPNQTRVAQVTLFYHRPEVQTVVATAVQRHLEDGDTGKLAVLSCGPPRMTDDTRSAVVRMLGDGHAKIDFYPESFTW